MILYDMANVNELWSTYILIRDAK